jgi:V/A-type H+-transporting ATPase subunit E
VIDMGALENITGRIKKDATQKARGHIDGAKKKADKIAQMALKELEKEKKALEMETDKAIKLQRSRAISEAKLEARKMKLAAKEEVITRAFTMANERLAALSPAENERYLRNAIQNATTLLGGSLEISCNPKDVKMVTKLAKKIAPGSTVVSDDITLMGGAMIRAKDGSAQIDASFEGLLARMKNSLRKEVAETLFKTEDKQKTAEN